MNTSLLAGRSPIAYGPPVSNASHEERLSGPASDVETAAAVDLGSHSFHMIVARIHGGQLHVQDRLRERVSLAAGLDADRRITPAAMDRAVECLRRFGQRVNHLPAGRVRAVGTNTLRAAKNGAVLLRRAEEALGHPIEVISGREEARLIYLGVAQTNPDEGRRLVVDIGGGSTECILGDGFDIVEADSLYMGCVSFSERFFPSGVISEKSFEHAEIAAELELQPIARPYRKLGWQNVLGCSGTIHSIAAIGRANGWNDDGITSKCLKKLRKALIAAGDVKSLTLPGLTDDRRPVITGGVAILHALFKDLGVEKMSTSPGALREGALYDLIGRIHHEDIRERTIRWFQGHYHVDVEHADRVEQTALGLLDQAKSASFPRDPAWAEQQLRWASRLFEIGVAINHTGFHKHSAYLVQHSYMAGFSRGEQQILAAIIMASRRKVHSEAFAALDSARVGDVTMLAVLLRLAVQLNRSRDVDLPRFALRMRERDRLKLSFPVGWLDERPLTLAALEEEAKFLAAFGIQLSWRATDAED